MRFSLFQGPGKGRLRPASRGIAAVLLACPVWLAAAGVAHADSTVSAAKDDAFVARDATADEWTIGTSRLEVTIGFDAAHTVLVKGLRNPVSERTWDIAPAPDSSVILAGQRMNVGGTSQTFIGASASATAHGVQLTLTYEHPGLRVRLARHYAAYPQSPTVEAWTSYEALNAAGSTEVSGIVALQLTMGPGLVKLLGGLRGDTADTSDQAAFAFDWRELAVGERIEIGADGRSTERDVPFVMVDSGDDEFYSGLMWSGTWRMALERTDDRVQFTTDFPGIDTAVGVDRILETPHGFFGVLAHAESDETGALRPFVMEGIRQGRPFNPLVTYNSWFAYGVRVEEDAMAEEMRRAAALGVELVVMDAGWYVGAGANGDFDFTSGLGSWEADVERFPSGLSALAEEAHGAGMLFGIWVEPERVALTTVGKTGLARESWLATRDGVYGPPDSAQICLAGAAAKQWVLERLVALIEEAKPDYLKWDNNYWVNCNRTGHGHGAGDGNFQHTRALYDILAEIRRRYPSLLIENVSGGGNRLDFGMLAYSDTAWMDDRTSPSSHVRHNLEGLTFAFPPAYLLSFVIDSEEDPLGGEDLRGLMRSRMPGILGLTYRHEDVDDTFSDAFKAEIETYKRLRDVIRDANATLLTRQTPLDGEEWDILQEVTTDHSAGIVFAYKASADVGSVTVKPVDLTADVVYDVTSIDYGPLGSATGAGLMADGITIQHEGGSRAHILLLQARN